MASKKQNGLTLLEVLVALVILAVALTAIIKATAEKLTNREQVLGQDWEWQGFMKNTGNARIHEVHVRVFHLPDHRLITELTGYTYGT